MAGRKFVPPDEKARALAVGSLEGLPDIERHAFDPQSKSFQPVAKPRRGDWLAEHTEYGQSFAKFQKDHHNSPHSTYRAVRILPIGEFPSGASPPLEVLRDFAAAFFHSLPVCVDEPVPLEQTGATMRTNPHSKNRQVLVGDVMRFAAEHSKRHARTTFCTIAVTMEDLYPRDEWNFVFGMASLLDSVGAFSFARYHPAFPHSSSTPLPPADLELLIQRSCSVLAHECVHMFGIKHCIYFNCLMNGSNHLEEADSRPHHLCPVCLRKMTHSVRWNVLDRYKALQAFYERADFQDDARWCARRIQELS